MGGYTPVPDETKLALLKALAEGTDVRQVAADHHMDVTVVLRVASAHGYPDRAKLAWAADVVAQQTPTETAPTSTAAPAPAQLDGSTAALLARAAKSTKARTRTLAQRIAADLTDLQTRVNDEAAEARARAAAAATKAREQAERKAAEAKARREVARLEAELKAARAALRSGRPATAGVRRRKPVQVNAAFDAGVSAKTVRTWATQNGVECPAVGKVPGRVVDAYLAAGGQAEVA